MKRRSRPLIAGLTIAWLAGWHGGVLAQVPAAGACKTVFTTDGFSSRLIDRSLAVDAEDARTQLPNTGETLRARLPDGSCADVRLLPSRQPLLAVAIPDSARVGEAVPMMALLSRDLGPVESEAVLWQTSAGKPVRGRIVEQVFPRPGTYMVHFWLDLPDGRIVFNTYDIEIRE